MEKDEILSRWSEYIGELYNDDNRGDMPPIAAEVESAITRREIEHVLRGMPEKKSPGPNGITTEMLVAAGEMGILEPTELSNMIHNQGTGNAIFVLRRIVERSAEKQRDVYTCFIDYSKAFDTVKHASLVELLQSLDVDKSETMLLTNLY